jgi:hypothetical protein
MWENKTFVNDDDFSNFSFLPRRFRDNKLTNEGLSSGTDAIKDLPRGHFGIKRRKKITRNQKFSRLKWHFNNSKFLQNYLQLLSRKKQLQDQLKVMRNQQEVQKVQSEISLLESQIKQLQTENTISLQRKVEGAVPTEIIQAVMVSSIPTSGVANDSYIEEISNSVSDSSVEEIPTNIPSDNESTSSGRNDGIGDGTQLPQQEVLTEQTSEAVDKTMTDLPKKNNTLLYLGIGVIAVLLLTRK